MGSTAGSYQGQDRFDCRKNLWKDMEDAVGPGARGSRLRDACPSVLSPCKSWGRVGCFISHELLQSDMSAFAPLRTGPGGWIPSSRL